MKPFFEFLEDKQFFADLLCSGDTSVLETEHINLFDFRSPSLKRKEFNRMRPKFFKELIAKHGKVCQLHITPKCNLEKGLAIDHFIPLSSNELNKKLRHLKALPGKKVLSQSFGSNSIQNLLLACNRCNNYKKYRIFPRSILKV